MPIFRKFPKKILQVAFFGFKQFRLYSKSIPLLVLRSSCPHHLNRSWVTISIEVSTSEAQKMSPNEISKVESEIKSTSTASKNHQKSKVQMVLPRNLRWNLKMMVSKRNLRFQELLFRFHVKFQGCANSLVKNQAFCTIDPIRSKFWSNFPTTADLPVIPSSLHPRLECFGLGFLVF